MKGAHSVAMLCELLGVSRSGYYRWKESAPTTREREDDALADKIVQAHADKTVDRLATPLRLASYL